MTFDAFEESVEGSQPIEHFVFTLGATIFRYTSAEAPLNLGGTLYDAIPIKRSSTGKGQEERAETVEIELPASNTFVRLYRGIPPGLRADVTISRFQFPDGATPQIVRVYKGAVKAVSFKKQARLAILRCQSVLAGQGSRSVPHYVFSSLCNHELYDERCKVIKDVPEFRLIANVSSVSGRVITVPGAAVYGSGWFQTGYVEAHGGTDRRLVLQHVGDDLELRLPFAESVFGQEVRVFAGCLRDGETCHVKFLNRINFGGWEHVPTKNPFVSGIDG
jgi:uncharacterized phage protein (TIGR02218 family)